MNYVFLSSNCFGIWNEMISVGNLCFTEDDHAVIGRIIER